MAIPTVLTSEDSGAPALTGQDGAMRAVLKWALPLLGWSEEFDDAANEKVVFRNNPTNGSGYYIQVLDKASLLFLAGADQAEISAFLTMSDVNTGTGQTPLQNGTSQVSYLVKSATANATERKYEIIGNETAFIFLVEIEPENDPGWVVHFVGDAVPRDPVDNMFLLMCPSGESTVYDSVPEITGLTSGGDPKFRVLVSHDGVTTNLTGRLTGLSPISGSSSLVIGHEGKFIDPVTGDSYVGNFWVTDTNVDAVRGRLPGLFVPFGDWLGNLGNNKLQLTNIQTDLGTKDLQYVRWRERSNTLVPNDGAVLIDKTGDWSG